MEYRMEEMEAFQVVGLCKSSTNENQAGYKDIPAFWAEVTGAGRQMEILPLMDRAPFGILGVSVYNTDAADAQKFDYYIGCATTKDAPVGMQACTVPAATWVVFPCKVADIGTTEVRAITEWLPQLGYTPLNSGYETGRMNAAAPDIERYGEGDDAEVWVAVHKK